MGLSMITFLAAVVGLGLVALQHQLNTRGMALAAEVQTVEMKVGEFRFEPDRITVKPGVIRFVVSNVGELRHVLTVEWEGGLGGASVRILPGETKTLEVTLETPGSYLFFCPLETEDRQGGVVFHRAHGMEGRLVVTGG